MADSRAFGNVAVLTSGGDAPGMNPAVRAVVRTARHAGLGVYVVYEGYLGLVDGGPAIQPFTADEVGGILQRGGSVIGSARSEAFRTREGRRRAAANLLARDIDGLVVIGGDGSLTGANTLAEEWPDLLAELVAEGEVTEDVADAHPVLRLVGLVGSIDNDMAGTDMTIGTDSALHRIVEAVDAIHATAASHQRAFVIEVMGRDCGYLALMASLATAANWTFIPERPPDEEDWTELMCRSLEAGRASGRRQTIVLLAEGARDRSGTPITSTDVQEVLAQRLGEDARVTVLGHVQRGGSPSAFDRYLGTVLGHAAVELLRAGGADTTAQLVGLREHEIVATPLMPAVARTRQVATCIAEGRYDEAMRLRGGSFVESFERLVTLTRSQPRRPDTDLRRLRFAVLHAGGPAPGMNTAVRAAVRLGLDAGHEMLGVRRGFRGLAEGRIEPLDWMSVSGWVSRGGAELGISRAHPEDLGLERIAEQVAAHRIDGILMVGGHSGYRGAHALHRARAAHPDLRVPLVCLPASINNDLPASDLSVGADTALNSIVEAVDKIKQSAVASRRCFVVEVMGRDCGYLALLAGLSVGAERVYLPEDGISLSDLIDDVGDLIDGFDRGKRLGLMIRSEHADPLYTTGFLHALFAKEGADRFDVREAILGHLQQGGDPSPFDRILATRMAARAMEFLIEQAGRSGPASAFLGIQRGRLGFTDLSTLPELVEPDRARPVTQSWLWLREVADVMAARTDRAAAPAGTGREAPDASAPGRA